MAARDHHIRHPFATLRLKWIIARQPGSRTHKRGAVLYVDWVCLTIVFGWCRTEGGRKTTSVESHGRSHSVCWQSTKGMLLLLLLLLLLNFKLLLMVMWVLRLLLLLLIV